MSPIERAAQVLAGMAYDRQYCGLPSQPSREQFVDLMTASYRTEVRNVLKAIREPSNVMLVAGASTRTSPDRFKNGDETLGPEFTAMIDALLD